MNKNNKKIKYKHTMREKHYLIIGGTRGIGKKLAQMLAKHHHRLSIVGRHLPTETQGLGSNVRHWQMDLFQEESFMKSFSQIIKDEGKISHLIFAQRYRGTDDDWEGEFRISLTATKKIIELAFDCFDDTPEKSIVIVNSISSFLVGLEQPVSYHVAKAGLSQLVRYFAVILGPRGVRINCVSPCTVLKDESKQFYLNNTKLNNLYKRIIPLGRMGTAKEISDIIEYLCSPASTFITGQTIIADGGLSLISQEALARDLASVSHPSVQKNKKRN